MFVNRCATRAGVADGEGDGLHCGGAAAVPL